MAGVQIPDLVSGGTFHGELSFFPAFLGSRRSGREEEEKKDISYCILPSESLLNARPISFAVRLVPSNENPRTLPLQERGNNRTLCTLYSCSHLTLLATTHNHGLRETDELRSTFQFDSYSTVFLSACFLQYWYKGCSTFRMCIRLRIL